MANAIPTVVQGNSYPLALPIKVYVIDDGNVVLEDYTPDTGDDVCVQLQGTRRTYTYTPTIEGNVATIQLGGYELVDTYAVSITIVKDDDTHLRAFNSGQFKIVESVEDMPTAEIAYGVGEGVIYLDTQFFIQGEPGEPGVDGRGIVSITKTATSGLVDTYTITYTDGTTSTFTVTNGADGQDGQDGADGVGIASITEQTSSASGGVNVVTVILTDGTILSFTVRNGVDGQTPDMSQYALKSDLATKADVTTLVEVTSTGDVTQALESGKFYRFGSIDSLTITLTAASAGMGQYAGKFTASANWSALGLPATVDEASGNDTVGAGKTYEFNILDNIIVIKEM